MNDRIINRILIHGTSEEVENIYHKYSTIEPRDLRKNSDGEILCYNKNTGEFLGWHNPDNNEFEYETVGEVVTGLPVNAEYDYSKVRIKFPDFEKISPSPQNMQPHILETWRLFNWKIQNNCFMCKQESNGIFRFETIQNGVLDMVAEISRQNPKVKIEYEYYGQCKEYTYKSYLLHNGKITAIKN